MIKRKLDLRKAPPPPDQIISAGTTFCSLDVPLGMPPSDKVLPARADLPWQRAILRKSSKNNNGFTIIELMIATTVFSVVLLLAATGLLHISRVYYKGLTSSATQEVARNIMQEISQEIELSGGFYIELVNGMGVPDVVNGSRGFCIGSHLYSYVLNQKIDDTNPHAFVVRDLSGGCDTVAASIDPDDVLGAVPNPAWRELLGPNMRVHILSITPELIFSGKPQAAGIKIKILSGDDDLFDNNLVPPTTGFCKGGAGSQFCASSELTTYATRRLKVN